MALESGKTLGLDSVRGSTVFEKTPVPSRQVTGDIAPVRDPKEALNSTGQSFNMATKGNKSIMSYLNDYKQAGKAKRASTEMMVGGKGSQEFAHTTPNNKDLEVLDSRLTKLPASALKKFK